MRILLADDQVKVRSALRLLLNLESNMDVVGEVVEAGHLLAGVQEIRPDVLLLDWELPGLSFNGQLAALRAICPRLAVIALSGRPEARGAALDAGADLFVSKCEPPERLLAALHAAREMIQQERGDMLQG